MNTELLEALNILEEEKDISKETLLDAIENSLLNACKNHFGKADNIKLIMDRTTCDYQLFAEKTVVEDVEDKLEPVSYTHLSQEAFADSTEGDASTTIMGMGAYLSDLLNNTYGIETLHHEGVYDLVDGKLDRSMAYQLAEPQIQNILAENPSIEVVIDLHRDGVAEGTHLVTEINGRPTAQIMFLSLIHIFPGNHEFRNVCIKKIRDRGDGQAQIVQVHRSAAYGFFPKILWILRGTDLGGDRLLPGVL